MNDSTINGVVNFYIRNYDSSSEKTYKRGVLDSPARCYYPDHQLEQMLNYAHGKENGEHVVFDSYGNVIYKDYYFNGSIRPIRLRVSTARSGRSPRPRGFSFGHVSAEADLPGLAEYPEKVDIAFAELGINGIAAFD